MKLLSLFDGSGGFPLAAALCGIEPVMASEVEPYPIAVTKSRFPNMRHLGDVSKVKGDEIEPVDIITFGSPCQDLSVAGLRKGLKHEANGDDETTRSGLFMEAIRIIKEMRDATGGKYPTFAIWENVPGAFSSNKGEDFRVVLEEFVKVVEPSATMPAAGAWPYADAYVGEGWSLAYRTIDAQYWGVPQRRRRIYLVADFRGGRASKILFEREGLRGYFETSEEERQAATQDAGESAGAADRAYTLKIRGGVSVDSAGKAAGKGALIQEDKSATLGVSNDQYLFQPVTLEPGIAQREGGHVYEGVSGTLRANAGDNQMSVAYTTSYGFNPEASRDVGVLWLKEKSKTLANGTCPGHHNGVVIMDSIGGRSECALETETAPTLKATHYKNPPCITEPVYALDQQGGKGSANYTEDVMPTLCSDSHGTPHAVAIPIHDQATRFSGKHGDKQDGKGNGLGVGAETDPMFTLTQGDHHAVALGIDRAAFNQGEHAQYDFTITEEQSPTIIARGPNAVCMETFHCNTEEEKTPAIKARDYKDPLVVAHEEKELCYHAEGNDVQYIVRRLTPLECNRLQGFPDGWGEVYHADNLTSDETVFWTEVRDTFDKINGRVPKVYSYDSTLKWYNNLHTDSAEYKMWGNGIALPCALYVMQGIALEGEKDGREG